MSGRLGFAAAACASARGCSMGGPVGSGAAATFARTPTPFAGQQTSSQPLYSTDSYPGPQPWHFCARKHPDGTASWCFFSDCLDREGRGVGCGVGVGGGVGT